MRDGRRLHAVPQPRRSLFVAHWRWHGVQLRRVLRRLGLQSAVSIEEPLSLRALSHRRSDDARRARVRGRRVCDRCRLPGGELLFAGDCGRSVLRSWQTGSGVLMPLLQRGMHLRRRLRIVGADCLLHVPRRRRQALGLRSPDEMRWLGAASAHLPAVTRRAAGFAGTSGIWFCFEITARPISLK